MNAIKSHPSYLTLDRMALGVEVSNPIKNHVEHCPRCQEYLQRMQQIEPLPAWVSERKHGQLRGDIKATQVRFGWEWILAGIVTSAIIIGIFLNIPRFESAKVYSITKGTPTVGIYIRRGKEVFFWDGLSLIEPGDRLRLQVVPEGFTHINVFSRSPTKISKDPQFHLLHEQEIPPKGSSFLSTAWEVDSSNDSETIIVVLSKSNVSVGHIKKLIHEETASKNFWIREFVLNKKRATQRDH